MHIVRNTQLVRNGQQQGIGLLYSLVFAKLLNKDIRLRGIAATEDNSRVPVDESNFVLSLTITTEVCTITIVDQCENASAMPC